MNLLGGMQIQQAMKRNPPLSRAEELKVARRAVKGDKAARDKLILCNLGILLMYALKYRNTGVPLDDVVQYGVLGMLRAVDKFDPERGWRFNTYAVGWIKAMIADGLGIKEPMVRLASGRARLHAMKTMGLPPAVVLSLDAPANEDASKTWVDLIESDEASQQERMEREMHRAAILARLDELGLTVRERDIIESRFMRDRSHGEDTLGDIGARWGVSRERIRQIEMKLRSLLEEELADLAA